MFVLVHLHQLTQKKNKIHVDIVGNIFKSLFRFINFNQIDLGTCIEV